MYDHNVCILSCMVSTVCQHGVDFTNLGNVSILSIIQIVSCHQQCTQAVKLCFNWIMRFLTGETC